MRKAHQAEAWNLWKYQCGFAGNADQPDPSTIHQNSASAVAFQDEENTFQLQLVLKRDRTSSLMRDTRNFFRRFSRS
jgi:hypothetical protein